MNVFVEFYKKAREQGKNEYESLGIASTYIVDHGTQEDLEAVYDYFSADLNAELEKFFNEMEEFANEEYQTA